jgi:hypothetical protein
MAQRIRDEIAIAVMVALLLFAIILAMGASR